MSILKIRYIYPARKEKKNLAQLSKFSVYICKIVFKAFFLFHDIFINNNSLTFIKAAVPQN